MSKQAVSLRLSKAALATIDRIAKRENISKTDAVEFVLKEFSQSTPEQVSASADRRRRALHKYLDRFEKQEEEKRGHAWQRGFSEGWLQYQGRHFIPIASPTQEKESE